MKWSKYFLFVFANLFFHFSLGQSGAKTNSNEVLKDVYKDAE
jgi:hypothetical protein